MSCPFGVAWNAEHFLQVLKVSLEAWSFLWGLDDLWSMMESADHFPLPSLCWRCWWLSCGLVCLNVYFLSFDGFYSFSCFFCLCVVCMAVHMPVCVCVMTYFTWVEVRRYTRYFWKHQPHVWDKLLEKTLRSLTPRQPFLNFLFSFALSASVLSNHPAGLPDCISQSSRDSVLSAHNTVLESW